MLLVLEYWETMAVFGIVILGLFLLLLRQHYDQKHHFSNKLKHWALNHGFKYFPKNGRVIQEHREFTTWHLCSWENGVENYIAGKWNGYDFFCFEYFDEVERGEKRIATVFISSPFELPQVLVCPDNSTIVDRLLMTERGIQFESTEFSRKMYVSSTDRKKAYDVLHSRAIELLMQHPQFKIEFRERSLCFWLDQPLAPQLIEEAATLGANLLDLVPEYVKDDVR